MASFAFLLDRLLPTYPPQRLSLIFPPSSRQPPLLVFDDCHLINDCLPIIITVKEELIAPAAVTGRRQPHLRSYRVEYHRSRPIQTSCFGHP